MLKTKFSRLFWTIGLFQWFYFLALPLGLTQPSNDNCDTPSPIGISDNGYDTGTFTSETVELTAATVVFGEYFDQSQVLAANDKKSIWYQFYLPTAREIRLELFQIGNDIKVKDAGFTTFYAAECLPGAAEITAAKLTPLPKFGSTAHPCMDPGFYLIQVSGSAEAAGSVFLQLDITPSFTLDETDEVVFDTPLTAYEYGVLADNQAARVNYDFGCHSIDRPSEFNCLPVANPSEYTQSSWHTFTTNDHVDLVNIEVQTSNQIAVPDTLGYRIYKGDVKTEDLNSLEIVEECSLFNKVSTKQVKEHICELAPNTTYSFQILFHQDYFNENLRVQVRQRGERASGAPLPVASQADAIATLGVLAQDATGVVTTYVDNFACNGRLSLSENQCAPLQQALGVYNPTDSNIIYDLANWMTFEIAAVAEVKFDFSGYDDYRYFRLYRGTFTENCNDFNPSDAIFENTFRDATIQCLSSGTYSVQFLGSSEHPDQKNKPSEYFPRWEDGNLGRTINATITAKNIQSINRFSLQDANAVDLVNNQIPLISASPYTTQADTFGCGNTIVPDDGTCDNRAKVIYRAFTIGEAGMLRISDMKTRDNQEDIHYKLFAGNLQETAIAQNTFSANDTLRGNTNYLEGCITDNHNSDRGYYCVVPNDYTLTSFGGDAQRNDWDSPTLEWTTLNSKYISRSLAEDLGDLSDSTSIETSVDVFSCLDNPDTLGGLAPCVSTTKLIYRQFYIDQAKITSFTRPRGFVGTLRLYKGQATDLNATLSPWEGLKANNRSWTSCFTEQATSDCQPLTSGWYTLVAYGSGASYDRPSMDDSNGLQNDLGKENKIIITFKEAGTSLYNRPHKAYDGGTTDWNLATSNDAYPNTKKSYPLGTETFTCIPDTPFINHPILACESDYNRVAYYNFTLTTPAFVDFKGIPANLITKVYPLDVRKDSMALLTTASIYPCLSSSYRQICGLEAGTYTLVIFASDKEAGSTVTPTIVVDKVGTARFDHAQNAYDFAAIPNDGFWYNGRVGDVHPIIDSLAPSNDMIYCSTGAQESDPMDNVCESGYNASVYNGPLLYEDSLAFRSHTLRNVWYTFVLSGAGKATLSVKHFSGTTPLMNVYQSDVDGAISFSELQQNGGIDSTETDGLVLLDNNFVRCNRSREQSVSFIRSGCQTAPNRYYVVLTEWHDTEPNQQVALDIKYEGEAVPPTRFDHYHTANVINGLEQTTAPYEPALLADGKYQGTPMSFQCASRDFGDPIDNACYDRSVWYKFETAVSGQARIAFENVNSGDKGRSEYMRLYRETIPGDSTSLVEVPLKNFNRSNSLNDTGHDWKEGCFSPGAYYLFWYTCNDAFNIFETYRPLLWLFQNEGDFCATAIPFNLDGIGTADASLRVDCHTIGEGFGEDGSNMGCLFGPEDYKSSWFKLSLTGEDKVDVTFNLKENTSVFPDQIRYRILYGTCTAITSGPCNTDANTVFTLNCMTEGDYFIQVVTPAGATGTLDISVSSLVTPEEFCQPLLPLEPNANFTYENDCESDTIFFQNKSSAGADISYLWEFPDGSTSTEINPTYLHPRIDTFQTITVNLQVINTALNLVDSVRIPVFILPTLNIFSDTPALACNGDTSTLDVSYPNATYLWQDGSTAPNFSYSDPGLYWVEVTVFGCTIRDSVIAIEKNCIFNTLDIQVCENVEYKGDLYQNDTSFIEIFPIEATIDSIVTTNISVLRTVRVERDTAICEGENIQVGTSIYATTDTYTDVFQTSEQCDSTVITNLMVYPKSQLDIQGVQAFCAGDSISLSVADQYTNYQWSTNGTSSKIEITQGGDYTLMVIDTNGCQATQSITVPDPIVLTSSIRATSDYNRFNISCNGLADGRAEVTVDNGQAPYTFQWNDGQSNAIANALAAASYTVSISDALGCTTENAITLNEPPVLAPDLMPFPVRCFGEKNGAVSVEIAGPTAPYEFSFNESSFTNNNYFENLPAGTYPIVLKDINACEWSGNIVVDEPELLRLNITPDYKEIFLGDSIEMNILTNAQEIATIEWSPKSYMRCDTCITITTRPLTSVTYTARLVDSAGCVATNEASLLVQKDDRVFIPTAFSPNNDGENDRFTIFTGPNVERIHSLIIVNRWGELLFERYNFQPNDTSLGWDGKHKGQLLNPAVFIYYAEVEFYGGEMGEYKGAVTLIEN